MLKKFAPAFLPVLTALLLVLSYPRFSQGWLAWFALAPLSCHILKSRTLKEAAAGGLACGFLFYLGALYWLYPTMRAGGVGPVVSALGLVLLSLILSAEFVLAAAYGFRVKRTGLKIWPYLFALGWFLLEYGKIYLSQKAVWFPWFMLGYTQWEHTKLIQIVSVTGVYGLGAALCFSGALLGSLFPADAPLYKKALRFSPAVLLFAGLWAFGKQELERSGGIAPGGSLNAALLQPSVDLYAKWDAAEAGNIKSRIEGLLAGAKGADLAVWPENALPCWLDEADCAAWLTGVSSGSAAGSIVGSVSRDGGRHVAAFLLDGKGEITASYNKRRLVPFGEYVPFRDFLGGFVRPVAALGEFEPGDAEQRLLNLKGTKIGVAICYESIFPYLFAGDTRDGADVFVNITNDGWYLDTAAPYQHFVANIFRAAENRRAVVRAANNGISAVIDPWGRVLAKTALNERTVLRARAPLCAERAFFPLYGHWFAVAALLVVSAFLLAVLFL